MARDNRKTLRSKILRLSLIAVGSLVIILALIVGGLFLASPIRPQAWTPPEGPPSPSCDGAPLLQAGVLVDDLPGTADGLAFDDAGRLYAALANGSLVRIDVRSGRWQEVGATRPPALLTGLAVVDAGQAYAVDERGGGLYGFRLQEQQVVTGERLVDAVSDRRLRWTNDVTVTDDGLVFFTATSQRRNLDENFLEVLEHAGSGQLLVHNPATGSTRELSGTLQMANGIAPGARPGEVLVVETSEYRVLGFRPVDGGGYRSTVAVDNLPGMPGNIRRSPDGSYWLALLSPRSGPLDNLAETPSIRRLMAWMPANMRPRPAPVTCVIQIAPEGDGYQAHAYRLAGDGLPSFSTAIARDGRLYLSPAGFGRPDEPRLYVADLPG